MDSKIDAPAAERNPAIMQWLPDFVSEEKTNGASFLWASREVETSGASIARRNRRKSVLELSNERGPLQASVMRDTNKHGSH